MIIGIAGKARSGKDTLGKEMAKHFKKAYNEHYELMAFADALKSMCKDHFGLSTWQVYGNEKEIPDKRYPRPIKPYCEGLGKSELPYSSWTPREIMQELGSFYRKIDNDFWVKALDERIKELGNPNVIITDVRHVNECEYVKNNGYLIKLTRYFKSDEEAKINGMDHESETALDGISDGYFDLTVINQQDLEMFKLTAHEVVEIMLEFDKLQGGTVYNG